MFLLNSANLIVALVIAAIITAIAGAKNPKIKAMIYALPIPATTMLIATGNPVNATHLLGMILLIGFLWGVYFLAKLMPILIADIIATISYVGVGWLLASQISRLSFMLVASLMASVWFFLWRIIKKRAPIETDGKRIPLPLKSIIVFIVSLLLLGVKDSLGGVAVTFPLVGIFAVIEVRDNLYFLARNFTVSSIAIAGLFVSIYFAQPIIG